MRAIFLSSIFLSSILCHPEQNQTPEPTRASFKQSKTTAEKTSLATEMMDAASKVQAGSADQYVLFKLTPRTAILNCVAVWLRGHGRFVMTSQTQPATGVQELAEEERAARLRELLDSEPLPMIQKSIDVFRRDLPELLRTHPGQWVAYHGDERVGFGRTETELYQRCFARGLTRDDFIVGFAEPGAFDPDDEIEVTCWDV